MKGTTLFLILFLAVMAAVGWFSFFSASSADASTYDEDIAQADEWVEEGLYQRAILSYNSALSENPTEEGYKKLMNAYEKRYEEDTGILSDYTSALCEASAAYPQNTEFAKKLVDIYIYTDDYSSAYNQIMTSIANGIEDPSVIGRKNEIKYKHELHYRNFTDMKSTSNSLYVVYNGEKCGIAGPDGNMSVDFNYDYISPVSGDGTMIYSYNGSDRLIANDGLVMGIFDFSVNNAGVYSDGLIPVLHEGKYSYYDSFAKMKFGGYDCASSFSSGVAVVKKDGNWFAVDTEGKESEKKFADVKLDINGNYHVGPVVIAAEKAGDYGMYDENFKRVNSFSAEDMDICTANGIIAFKSGGKWGFADTNGNIVIEPQYEEAKSFSCGLAAVKINGKWGFINTANELVTECDYDDADYFNSNGSCMVRSAGDDETDGEDSDEPMWKLLILELGIVG